jgi:hypothetical protein
MAAAAGMWAWSSGESLANHGKVVGGDGGEKEEE